MNKCTCGAIEGEEHDSSKCDLELCPFCTEQSSTCDCMYGHLRLYNRELYTKETDYLPPDVYKNGPTDEQKTEWNRLCVEKGDFPFILFPRRCIRCGTDNQDHLFDAHADGRVSIIQWNSVIPRKYHRNDICKSCYEFIKTSTMRLRAEGRKRLGM